MDGQFGRGRDDAPRDGGWSDSSMAVEPIVQAFYPALPKLFAELPDVFAGRYDPEAPWALLGEPLTAVLDALPSDAIEIRPLASSWAP